MYRDAESLDVDGLAEVVWLAGGVGCGLGRRGSGRHGGVSHNFGQLRLITYDMTGLLSETLAWAQPQQDVGGTWQV